MKNNSDKVRESVIKYYGFISELFDDQEQVRILFWNSLNTFDKDGVSKEYLSPYMFNISRLDEMKDTGKFLSVTSKIQMYTDFYRFDKLSAILNNGEVKEFLLKNDSYEKINKYFNSEQLPNYMLYYLMKYTQASGYTKVLLNKCLNEDDIKLLSSINPFFMEEYEKSNVLVNLDFIKKHIGKWQKSLPDDEDESYIESADFIMKLYKLREKEATDLLIELFRQDLGIISYDNDDVEIIKIGQISVSRKNLAIMLKDYYKYETEALKR